MKSDNRALRLLLIASTALTLAASPALADEDLVKSGFVRAYTCQEGAVALETIHGLSPLGFMGGPLFLSTYEFSEFDVDGFAGYVWSDIQPKFGPFENLRLVYEGDPDAVEVHFCFLRNGSPFNVAVPLSKFERRPDSNGLKTAILPKSKIKGVTPRDILELTTLRVELHKLGSKPQAVMFGDVRVLFAFATVEPVAVLTTVVNGDNGCNLRQTCL
jgi:hypothetical protein